MITLSAIQQSQTRTTVYTRWCKIIGVLFAHMQLSVTIQFDCVLSSGLAVHANYIVSKYCSAISHRHRFFHLAKIMKNRSEGG